MAELDAFVKTPSDELLHKCTKKKLIKIADHNAVMISDKWLKDTVKYGGFALRGNRLLNI